MTLWDLDDLASLMDIAREHGLSISTVFTWEVRYPEFPEPLAMLAGANIYSRTAVRKWMNTPRRPLSDRQTRLRAYAECAVCGATVGEPCRRLSNKIRGGTELRRVHRGRKVVAR